MGYEDEVLPESLTINHTANCLIYEGITRKQYIDIPSLFKALAFAFHEKKRLEKEVFKMLNLLKKKEDAIQKMSKVFV